MSETTEKTPLLLFVVNDAPTFVTHRLPAAAAAREAGCTIALAAPSPCPPGIAEAGIDFHPIPLSRSGMNPLADLRCLLALVALFRRLRPDLIHAFTIKPIIYGGFAARLTRVPAFVGTVSGLGTTFIAQGARAALMRRLIRLMYRVALNQRRILAIFQNPADRDLFIQLGIVPEDKTHWIRGSGVDVALYPLEPGPPGPVTFTFAARFLADKGIYEFAEAAAFLSRQGVAARFQIAGIIDPGNRTSLTAEQVADLTRDGTVENLGFRTDMPQVLCQSHVVVLPSYREGLPRILVEAAAAGRAVVTTDVPGCRNSVIAGETALVVPARDAGALAAAMRQLVDDRALRARLGAAGRKLAQRDFAVEKIIADHVGIYRAFIDAPDQRDAPQRGPDV